MSENRVNIFTSGIACVVLLYGVTGCFVKGYVRLRNGTPGVLSAKSDQSGDSATIKPNQAKRLYHSNGTIAITTADGARHEFGEIDLALSVKRPEYIEKHPCAICPGWICLNLFVNTNLEFYALRPGETRLDAFTLQPRGYPKTGANLTRRAVPTK